MFYRRLLGFLHDIMHHCSNVVQYIRHNHLLLSKNFYYPKRATALKWFPKVAGWNRLQRRCCTKNSLWLLWLLADLPGCLWFLMFVCKSSPTTSSTTWKSATQMKIKEPWLQSKSCALAVAKPTCWQLLLCSFYFEGKESPFPVCVTPFHYCSEDSWKL